ncbi:unnamed protein product [Sphagnum troendelagicum]|uniref:Uncharacterized protein n=1 Tax=Sphagnum troendelagicum TaxID=128251 RepID=A0ABP0V4N5_9BRYO
MAQIGIGFWSFLRMQATKRRLRLRQQCKNSNDNNEHAQRGAKSSSVLTQGGLVPGNTMDEYSKPWLKF